MVTIKHLGDITKISGYSAPIVDCIIGGSPCQDLSVAGKRAGLDGERSGLYIEQVRIVKEMRERDARSGRSGVDIRPRYMVWENVPGAFSSNKGDDFRIVLEEIAKVNDKDAVIPMPEKGKWTTSGCIVADGWSVAWRVLDAQFWGVPQRRRRIALVADFGGQSAPEVLFVSEGVHGHSEPSKSKRQEPSSDASRSLGADDCIGVDVYNTQLTGGKACPLTAGGHTSTGTCPKVMTTAYTLQDREGKAGSGKGALIAKELSATLRAGFAQTLFQPVQTEAFGFCHEQGAKTHGIGWEKETSPTVRVGAIPTCVYSLDRASFNQGKNAQYDFEVTDKGVNSPLVAKGPGAVCYSIDQGGGKSSVDVREDKSPTLTTTHDGAPAICYSTNHGSFHTIAEEGIVSTLQATDYKDPLTATYRYGTRYIVRRLTPNECEALQGYPQNWTNIGEYIDSTGKKRQTSDAARYKALGNSIALPPWKWVLKRLCACYERDATLGSLFDGIGGFPHIWEQLNGKGTCLWASEIEEFPMAVTKVRIGE